MNTPTELILGSAQFGLNYGIANSRMVPKGEVRSILRRSYELGIRLIDTAPGYGDIEKDICSMFDGLPFRVISKIAAIPRAQDLDRSNIEVFLKTSIYKSKKYLGDSLDTLLFHRSEDLTEEYGELIWEIATDILKGTNIKLGVSCYSPQEAVKISTRFPIAVAQVPGNAFDQRVDTISDIKNIEIHLRSIFLQGLLLLPPEIAIKKLPQAKKAVFNWINWCEKQDMSQLQGAIGFAKSFANVRYCVVGINNLFQLEEIFGYWSNTKPIKTVQTKVDDLAIIDPRNWPQQH